MTLALTEHGEYVAISRQQWKALAAKTELPLTAEDIERISSLNDPITLTEADAIYRPLSALLQRYSGVTGELHARTSEFLEVQPRRTPYVIAIAGSVSIGKSTVARLLQTLLSRWPQTPRVDLVPTDGFLFPNAVLEERGIMHRKGFPESYDRRRLLDFVRAVKSGEERVEAPVYDHTTYDIVPGASVCVEQPDILIIEGLNVLQPAQLNHEGDFAAVSDYFDFSIYVDADAADIERWYIERFLKLQQTAFSSGRSYFERYANLTEAQARATAHHIWEEINLPNLVENIAPTRSRATLVLHKSADHKVDTVFLRKV